MKFQGIIPAMVRGISRAIEARRFRRAHRAAEYLAWYYSGTVSTYRRQERKEISRRLMKVLQGANAR